MAPEQPIRPSDPEVVEMLLVELYVLFGVVCGATEYIGANSLHARALSRGLYEQTHRVWSLVERALGREELTAGMSPRNETNGKQPTAGSHCDS